MDEPIQVGLSSRGHEKLQRLKEFGHFAEMADAYRFAIALAIAHGISPAEVPFRGGPTIFNTGTLDPDRSLHAVMKALYNPVDEPVYKLAERLAEWGIEELSSLSEAGPIPFADLIEEAGALTRAANARTDDASGD